jgi:hypothetical protein
VTAVLILALIGCANGPESIAFTGDGGVGDPGTSHPQQGPFDITIASSPPIDVAGAVLWLDPNFGIAHAEADARTWTDRSGHGLVLVRPPAEQDGPTLDRLAGQAVLRFAGSAQLVLTDVIDASSRAALTLGTDGFVIAVVVQPVDDRPATLFTLTPDDPGAGGARLELGPLRFTFDQGGQRTSLEAPQPLAPGVPHLVSVSSEGGRLDLRVDGEMVAARELDYAALPFESPALGAPSMGFAGLLGDVVLVAGPSAASASTPLEQYLDKKYGL